jgi:hypothetical protein
VRIVFLVIAASAVIGTSAGATLGVNLQHVRDLVAGIVQDVGGILNSFAGGPDDPKSPVTNAATLRDDQQRLDEATRKAEQLATELHNLQNSNADRGR